MGLRGGAPELHLSNVSSLEAIRWRRRADRPLDTGERGSLSERNSCGKMIFEQRARAPSKGDDSFAALLFLGFLPLFFYL